MQGRITAGCSRVLLVEGAKEKGLLQEAAQQLIRSAAEAKVLYLQVQVEEHKSGLRVSMGTLRPKAKEHTKMHILFPLEHQNEIVMTGVAQEHQQSLHQDALRQAVIMMVRASEKRLLSAAEEYDEAVSKHSQTRHESFKFRMWTSMEEASWHTLGQMVAEIQACAGVEKERLLDR